MSFSNEKETNKKKKTQKNKKKTETKSISFYNVLILKT